jgi:uncharacterized protein (TIGR02118 family)
MVKLIAMFRKPVDVQAFDRAYFETHIPLVNKVPGLQRVEVSRITGGLGGEPDFYLIAELYFPDKETMDHAMASPENAEAGKNLMTFARGLVTLAFAEQVEAPAHG